MQNNDQVIATIAAALPMPEKPYPPGYGGDTEQEVRMLYAESWVRAGFDDPSVVVKWTTADVQDPSVARTAERQGFRPDDPWVARSGPSFTLGDGMAIAQPSPTDAITNREVAQAQWDEEQAREADMRAKAAAAARSMDSLMRGLDYDAGFSLTALDLLASTGQQATAEDVARPSRNSRLPFT